MKLHNATIHLGIETNHTADSFLGEGIWTFSYADLQLAIPEHFRHRYSFQYGTSSESFWEALKLECPEIGKSETVSIGNTDLAILILAQFGAMGGEFSVLWEGKSAFWPYHDMHHARNDVCVDDEGAEIEIDGDRETSALIGASLDTLRAGIALSDIVEELVQAEHAFFARFGYESFALPRFLDLLNITIPPEEV